MLYSNLALLFCKESVCSMNFSGWNKDNIYAIHVYNWIYMISNKAVSD